MRRYMVAGTALAILLFASTAAAQNRGSIELRGGAAIPTAELGEAALNTGAGAGLTASFRFMPHLMAYGGWDWFRLTTDEPFEGQSFDAENTGYAFGLQFQHPMVRDMEGWVRLGGLYNHVELEDEAGDLIADSGHEVGWEAGGGVSVPIGDRFALTPGVRYRTFGGEVDVGTGAIDFDMSYVALEVGFAYAFGGRMVAALRR